MKKVVLSKRLQALADMVSQGNRVCDVGCDHGFVSIYLVEQGISRRVIAMDVNPGPLERAQKHINDRNLSAYIETRLSDGLEQLQEQEADTVILAGMGGKLMTHILRAEDRKTVSLQELILQPQSEIPDFRRFLRESGYQVTEEEMVWEEDKFYPIMKVIPPQSGQRPVAFSAGDEGPGVITQNDRWGRLLLEQKHPVLKQYLIRELESHNQIIRAIALAGNDLRKQERRQELQKESQEIQQLLESFRR